MRILRAAVLASLALFAGPAPVSAQDVTLTSRDGEVEISGRLLSFDGEFYRLDTVYGEVTLDGSRVTCTGAGCPDLENFVAEVQLSGAAAMVELLMPALLEAFARRRAYDTEIERTSANSFTHNLHDPASGKVIARFEFAATTTEEGFADLLADSADIVLATREIRPEERERAREAGLGDLSTANRSRVFALDALVPVVSPGNPVSQISPQDLALVLAGEIDDWSALGGPQAPIALHLPDQRLGVSQSVVDRLLEPAGLALTPEIQHHASGRDVVQAVADDPHALGIASFSEMGDAKGLTLSGDCGFSLEATRRNIKTEDYPLTAPMLLYLPARRLPKIGRDFLAFLRSPSAQLVIRRTGFVDQMPEEIPIDEQGARLAHAIVSAGAEISLENLQRMVASLAPLQRLTTSFRFEAGSVRLDAQSRSNVQQLARALEQGRYDGRRLVFVGFSDGVGNAAANRVIALRRAEAVRRGVVAAARTMDIERVRLEVEAFGEALPMACDDSAMGRQTNRRVEVWVR